MRQFDDASVPMEPTFLRQGDSWDWQRQFADYPSNLYQLKYVFNSPNNRFCPGWNAYAKRAQAGGVDVGSQNRIMRKERMSRFTSIAWADSSFNPWMQPSVRRL